MPKIPTLDGYTVEEAAGLNGELDVDAIGLWQIVSTFRDGFSLKGDELHRAVRLNVMNILHLNAKPVFGDMDRIYNWKRTERYGASPDEIADAIIQEWIASGKDPDVGDVWFAQPHIYNELRSDIG